MGHRLNQDQLGAHTDALLARPGIVGTAVGLGANGRAVVLVFTEKAGVAGIPGSLDGVIVVPRVTGKIVAFGDPTERHRPAPPGVSTGHPSITAGTIGARVRDAAGNVFALSNNHVYADENKASIGDHVIQPGTFDSGSSPADDLGTLADFEPIVFSTSASNVIDAAIALSSTSLLDNATYCGWTPSSVTSAAKLRMKVKKCGRTTGATEGRVTGINATVNIGYGTGTARFINQIIIQPGNFSAGGDSGSLIVTKGEGQPTGLLFAGSSSITIANPIDPVLARFGVTIDDGAGPPPPANDPPSVSIASPDDSTFVSGAMIDFEGTASDTEDNNTTITASLAWSSSVDGSIGTGGSFSTTLVDGNHTITALVTDSGGKTASASVSITVGTPPATPTLSVKVETDRRTYQNRDTVTITVTVTDGTGPVSGAAVHIQLTAPKRVLACNVTTSASGVVQCTHKVNVKRDGEGTHTVDATASKSGFNSGSGSITFEATK